MRNLRESIWLPAAILVIGVALMFAVLAAADHESPAGTGVSAYPSPSPCLYLPVVRQISGAGGSAQALGEPFQLAPAATAYPPPTGPCGLQIPMRTYLPIIRK